MFSQVFEFYGYWQQHWKEIDVTLENVAHKTLTFKFIVSRRHGDVALKDVVISSGMYTENMQHVKLLYMLF